MIYERKVFKRGEEVRKQFTSDGKIRVLIEGHMWGCSLDDGTYVTLRIDYPPGHAPTVQLSMRRSNDPAGIVGQKNTF